MSFEHPPIDVCVLGATGSVGQRFVSLIDRHPFFRLVALAASERSAGRPYGDVVRWCLPEPLPRFAASMEVAAVEDLPAVPGSVAFSALDASVAGPLERAYAADGRLVVTNARNHRLEPTVPLLVPEVNPDALALLSRQEFGSGRIVANPNCSTIGLVLALYPLVQSFGVERVLVTSLQALSGAGLTGPTGFETTDNVLPRISGEEEKLERETRKILSNEEFVVSATCTRVPVVDGHTLSVSWTLSEAARPEDLIRAWNGFRAEPQVLGLPSAPEHPTLYLDDPDAPQPRLHRDLGGGMTVAVGRLRRCPILGWKGLVLSHNTVRGAAGGALLAAELTVARTGLP